MAEILELTPLFHMGQDVTVDFGAGRIITDCAIKSIFLMDNGCIFYDVFVPVNGDLNSGTLIGSVEEHFIKEKEETINDEIKQGPQLTVSVTPRKISSKPQLRN